MRRSRSRLLAWILSVAGVAVCLTGAAASSLLGAPPSFLLVYVVGALMGVLGALIAARAPRNPIGWLMCATALSTGLLHVPAGYAYLALAVNRGAWPLGSFAAWLGAWSWVPVIVFIPMISMRFPDGRVPPYTWAVDWIVVAGAVLFAAGIAFVPATVVLQFMAMPEPTIGKMLPYFHDEIGGALPTVVLAQVQGLGLTFILAGYVASAAALVTRLRGSRGDRRLQLKWFAYAGALSAAALVYGGVAWSLFGQPLYLALTPFMFAALALPLALGVAILRYRLYDIDLLINRTLVYASLTATLGAMYAAVVTFLNRMFISLSGQKTDAAYVITAFVVAVSFGPVKDWLQRQVDRWVGRTDAVQLLDTFRSDVDEVVAVLDVDRAGRELLDRAVAAFNARWAAFYVAGSDVPAYTRGDTSSASGLEVSLRYEGRDLGRLVMGERHGGASYGERDHLALQRSADSVAKAIALAKRLGHVREPVTVR